MLHWPHIRRERPPDTCARPPLETSCQFAKRKRVSGLLVRAPQSSPICRDAEESRWPVGTAEGRKPDSCIRQTRPCSSRSAKAAGNQKPLSGSDERRAIAFAVLQSALAPPQSTGRRELRTGRRFHIPGRQDKAPGAEYRTL